MAASAGSPGKLVEGWNTIRIEVDIGTEGYFSQALTNNTIRVYLNGTDIGWHSLNDPNAPYAFYDFWVRTDRECVFSTVGFELLEGGNFNEMLLDNIGIWAED